MCSYLCFGMAFRHYLSFAYSVVFLLIVKVDTISHMASIIFTRTPSKFQRQRWCIGVYVGVVVYMSMVPVSPAPSLSSAVNSIFGGLNRETSFGCLDHISGLYIIAGIYEKLTAASLIWRLIRGTWTRWPSLEAREIAAIVFHKRVCKLA